jgi:hypothetical protein
MDGWSPVHACFRVSPTDWSELVLLFNSPASVSSPAISVAHLIFLAEISAFFLATTALCQHDLPNRAIRFAASLPSENTLCAILPGGKMIE